MAAEQLLIIYEEEKSSKNSYLSLKLRDYRYYIHSSMSSRFLNIGGRRFIEFIVVNFVCRLCTKSVAARKRSAKHFLPSCIRHLRLAVLCKPQPPADPNAVLT